MNKLHEIANFFIEDAMQNNYSTEEVETTIKLQYEPIVSELIISQINFIISR